MKCRHARVSLAKTLWESAHDERLEAHVAQCTRCRLASARYRRVQRALAQVRTPGVPESAAAALAQLARDPPGRLPGEGPPPASPRPELPAAAKAVVAVLASVLLLGFVGVGLALSGARGEPTTPAAHLTGVEGAVELRVAGPPGWRGVSPGTALASGDALRTGTDGIAQVRDGVAGWRLAPLSALRVVGGGQAEAMYGRVLMECEAGGECGELVVGDRPVVRCVEGSLIAQSTGRRLQVGCVAGRVQLLGPEGAVDVRPGEWAMTMDGKPVGGVRLRRMAEAMHWSLADAGAADEYYAPRQLAAIPLRADPALGAGLSVDELVLDVRLRGPLAVLVVSATVRNAGGDTWSGRVSAGSLAPGPVIADVAGTLVVGPGEQGHVRSVALSLLRCRERRYAFGLNLRNWTAGDIERLTLVLDAAADGGIASIECPTFGYRARRESRARWTWDREAASPGAPVVVELRVRRRNAVDVARLEGTRRTVDLAAWVPWSRDARGIAPGSVVLLLYDPAAASGPGGWCYAQQVAETVAYGLPPRCYIGLMRAAEGAGLLGDGFVPSSGPHLEALMARLWEGGGPAGAGRPAGSGSGPAMVRPDAVVCIAGPRGPGAEVPRFLEVAGFDGPMVALQAGTDLPSPEWVEVCERMGGGVFALPGSMPPHLAASDALGGLWEGMITGVTVAGGGAASFPMGRSGFAGQPVLAVLPGGGSGAVAFAARAGAGTVESEARAPQREPLLAGELADELIRELEAAVGR
jgi:hypothetical protein